MVFKELFKRAVFNEKKIKHLNHYTTLNAVSLILKNHSLRLSRIDKVNDLIESNRVDKFGKLKGFVSCFTMRQSESYFFWKVYSKQSNNDVGIRITFPSEVLNLNDFFYDPECKQRIPIVTRSDFKHSSYTNDLDWGILASSNYKVLYVEDISMLRYEDKLLKGFLSNCVVNDRDFTRNALPYIVKTSDWDQEDEVRILAQVRPVGCETVLGHSLETPNFYPQPPFNYIYLKLTDDLLSKCIFTLSPLCTDRFEEVKKIISTLIGISFNQIQLSCMNVR